MVILDYLKSFSPIEIINAFICFGISLRLMSFRQGKSQHKFLYSFFAYILIVSSAAIFIRIVMKQYTHVDIWEVALNAAILLGTITARGNVARIIKKVDLK